MAKRIKQLVPSEQIDAPLSDVEARQQEIAQSAYYRAQAREFSSGAELGDWFEAERDIASRSAGEDA